MKTAEDLYKTVEMPWCTVHYVDSFAGIYGGDDFAANFFAVSEKRAVWLHRNIYMGDRGLFWHDYNLLNHATSALGVAIVASAMPVTNGKDKPHAYIQWASRNLTQQGCILSLGAFFTDTRKDRPYEMECPEINLID